MSFVDVIGSISYEVVAAASIAAASVAAAAAAYSTGRSSEKKRKHEEEQEELEEQEQQEEEEYVSPTKSTKNRRKVVGKKNLPAVVKAKESKFAQHFIDLGISPETVVDEFKRQSTGKWRHKTVYTFLDDRGKESVNYSFEDVDQAARKIAATLQKDHQVVKGDRVILCFPPGLDFALGFWGCLYAGAIGIPVYPPYPGTLAKDLPKFNRMVEDSGANVILTNRTYYLASKMATAKNFFSASSSTKWPENVEWVTVDSISDAMVNEYAELSDPLCLEDIAFFQYSSGSTSAPKAVMISHSNIRAQLETWKSIEPSDVLVSWLPSYHDMGLVGFIISPCVMGSRCVSMSPISFIKNPSLWMQTVSKYKATHVCAPNFGYALVARKVTDAQASQLDLSTLKQTICAAEPIRPDSLLAFTQKFQSISGFDPKTFNCGYGLAEVTLVCTGQDPLQRKEPVVLQVKKSLLEQTKQVQILQETIATKPLKKQQQADTMILVGCGKAMPTFEVLIVDPDTRLPCRDQHVGEIWISGPSVAQGYYHREDYTAQMFHATLAEDKSKSNHANHALKKYLRSGDMGFLYKGEVFVTGRLKDLIIIRGRNVCPQDVEATVEKAHEEIRPGCVAAFSIEKEEEQEEALVVVAEVRNTKLGPNGVFEKMCTQLATSIFMEHQLKCEAIVLLPTRAIPKTTSGKIQRSKAKSQFLAKEFNTKPVYTHRSSQHYHQPVTKTFSEVNSSPKKPKAATLKSSSTTTSPSALASPAKKASKEQAQVVNGSPSNAEIRSEEDILEWLMERVKREAPDAQEVTLDTPWACFGLDSVAIVSLSAELGEFLGCVVPPSAFFQYDTPGKLSKAPGLATGDLETNESSFDEANGVLGGETTQESLALVDSSFYEIESFPEVQKLQKQMEEFEQAGLQVPYLQVLPVPSKRKQMINFNTYNYLGNALNADVMTAAKKAIDVHGCTMSSSPIVGQTQVNAALEKSLSEFFHAEAAVLFVGGWVTNVTCIDALVGKGDLILADALNHDSCVTGQRLSGATILPFPHNDVKALENILKRVRMKYRRVLIVVEGVYSMDGDLTPLQEIIELKKKYKAIVFLDEAHSFGTMGKYGRGMFEHCGVDPKDIDIRMGTMSKALGSVGGFILGSKALISYIKHCAGGFVFSVGLAPVCAGAALKSIELMTRSCTNTQRLQFLSAYFYDLCERANLPMCKTGFRGAPVIVVIIGSTIDTAKASIYLSEEANINVKPIVYPAVEEGKCRLRFFISVLHTEKQLEKTVQLLTTYMNSVQ